MGKEELMDELFGNYTNISYEQLLETLHKFDKQDNFESNHKVHKRDFQKEFLDHNGFPSNLERSVIGLDILGYSQMEKGKQDLVPFLFKLLLEETYKSLMEYEFFLFHVYKNGIESLRKGFIPTGDGGFQILPNPLFSLVFAIHFQTNLQFFLCGRIYPELSKFYSEGIKLRYAMTYDELFRFDNNYYGKAIIHSARIMSKDKLDRCLMDAKSYRWFQDQFNGIETLEMMDYAMFQNSEAFSNFEPKYFEREKGMVIGDCPNHNGIQNIIVQDIGEINAKKDVLNVYNLFCQFSYEHLEINSKKRNKIRISLGNLNTTGIQN
ncbi:MAG: hypothetical protein O9346_08700 [Leptospiraceae bacterium]|nr:hypothetical protein [Leptospiraceae bacterium]MCZ8346480.1 hypothetical protein [Leptospiraceae bacterium]